MPESPWQLPKAAVDHGAGGAGRRSMFDAIREYGHASELPCVHFLVSMNNISTGLVPRFFSDRVSP